MDSDLWRWADPNGQQRTVSFSELRAALAGGLIAPNTPVWKAGWPGWQSAQEVPELTSASVGGANGVVLNIPPPPLAMVAVQQEYEAISASIAPAPPGSASLSPGGAAPAPAAVAEPPPPPAYVPVLTKAPSAGALKTRIGGSAGTSAPPPPVGASPASVPPRPPPNLPTALGLPPPPVAGFAQPKPAALPPPAPAGAARSKPPPPPPAPAPAVMAEELSGSALLDVPHVPHGGQAPSPEYAEGPNGLPQRTGSTDSVRGRARPANGTIPTPNGGLPPPTDPVLHQAPEALDDFGAGLPRRPGLSVIFDDIAAIRKGEPPKNKLLLGVIGVVGLSLVIMLIAGVVSLVSGPSKAAKTTASTKAAGSASSSTAARTVPSSTPEPPSAAPPPLSATPSAAPLPAEDPTPAPKAATAGGPDCTSTGETKLIAPRAIIASGIEAHAYASGLALAFAASPRDAVATSLEPATLAPTSTVRTRPAGGDARHVTPLMIGGKLTAVPDVDRKGDKLGGRRVVPTGSLIDIGHMDGAVQWTPHGRDSFAKLFTVDNEAQIEALRAVPLSGKKGVALAFRRGNAVLIGVAKGDNVLEPDGELSKIAGLGQVGSPAIAVSGDKVMVAWADRAGAQDDWKVRVARLTVGGSTDEATTFPIPEGGLGGQAMSPTLAGLGGGRFFIAWTEGPVSSHQIRGVAIGTDGAPTGSAVAVSASGVNAGQPAAVIANDGRGAVAFLVAKGKALEVHATPISCSSR